MRSIIFKNILIAALLALNIIGNELNAQDILLSMDDAVKISLDKNRDLQVSKLEFEKSGQRVKEAKGYALPTLYASGQYLYFPQKQVSFLPGSFLGTDDSQLAAIRVGGENALLGSVNISQPVFRPALISGIRSEKINQKMVKEEVADVKANVVTEVQKAYLDVLITQEQLLLLQQSVERYELALKDARSLLAQGRISRVDTLRAFVNMENLRPEIIRLTNAIEIGKTVLKRVIGLDENLTIELTDSLQVIDIVDSQSLKEAVDEALTNRPDIRRKKLEESYNHQIVQLRASERLPDLSAVGALQVQSQANNFTVSDYSWPVSSYVGLQLNMPLFSGLRTTSKVRQAQISLLQTEKQLENVKELILAEVKISKSKVEESLRRMEVQHQTVETAELGYQITRDRWKQGIATRLDLSDSELALTQSKSAYLQAVYDYLIANIELNRNLGRVEE